MSEIVFKSKWFEKCIREYLELGENPITQEKLAPIKYMAVVTSQGHELSFGTAVLPEVFAFDDAGDEWMCCCISDTGRFSSIEEFIDVDNWNGFMELKLKDEVIKAEKGLPEDVFFDKNAMKEFTKSVKRYYPRSADYEGVEEDEEACNSGMIFPEDFVYFKNLEVLRLTSCQWDVHSLKFLEALPKLRVLELGEVCFNDLDGADRLIGLEKLSIWSN